MNHPVQAHRQFDDSLKRTPECPIAIYGVVHSAQALGHNQIAAREFTTLLRSWRNADLNLLKSQWLETP